MGQVSSSRKFQEATKFVEALEAGKGWKFCQDYVVDEATTFEVQAETFKDTKTVKAYNEWMENFIGKICPDYTYELRGAAFDEKRSVAIFVCTGKATHTLDGGPVPPTNKTGTTDFVYLLHMNNNGKIDNMLKVWNGPFCMKSFGWPC